jgi:ATP-binding cassette subfamily B multidrug efflux pump
LTFAYPTGRTEWPGATGSARHQSAIPAGSTLAIVGPTGSGKSTLAALIARLWEAPPGTLLIDGRSIREYPLAELRKCDRIRAAGYVPVQRNDCAKTSPSAWIGRSRGAHLLEAAEIASISGEIQSFPQRLDTMVGERGVTLSGGQKQRTSSRAPFCASPKS